MKTWAEMRTEIYQETNTEGEDFVSDIELLAWANDAKKQAEKEIISLYDKYLETEAALSVTAGTRIYDLPTDIYAQKITGFQFNDGNRKYDVRKIKTKEEILKVDDNDDYKYRIDNNASTGIKIKFYPNIRETSASHFTLFYVRKSAAIVDDTDLMDIPIADEFIKQYIKDKIKEKEYGPAATQGESPALNKERLLMIEALNERTPDDTSSEMEMDLSHYEDSEDFYPHGGY